MLFEQLYKLLVKPEWHKSTSNKHISFLLDLIEKFSSSFLGDAIRKFVRRQNSKGVIEPFNASLIVFDRVFKKNNSREMDVLHGDIYCSFLSTGNHHLIKIELSCNQVSERSISFPTISILDSHKIISEYFHSICDHIVRHHVVHLMTARLNSISWRIKIWNDLSGNAQF